MKTALCAALLLLGADNIKAQDLVSLRVETRVDYQRNWVGDSIDKERSGFKGKSINLRVDGNITPEFSYSYNQRINKNHSDESFFDATCWLTLQYKKNHWAATAGKMVVAIGGYEYDRSPLDLYFCSEYWNNIPCYQLGAGISYYFNQDRSHVMAQVSESPFRNVAKDMYAYNIIWYGQHGWLNTIYSANMVEYAPGCFISYLALGHRIELGKKVAVELDLMNRAASHQRFFLDDMSVMGEVIYTPNSRWKMFGKMTYDVNRANNNADLCVMPGTEMASASAGVEFFPLKGKKDIRLHANAAYAWGRNGNPSGTMLPKQTYLDFGLKWNMRLLKI